MSKLSCASSTRFLALTALTVGLTAFAVPGCAGSETSGKDDKAKATPTADEPGSTAEPIAGKPVEGEQKVATAPGDEADDKQYVLQIDPGEAKVGEESKVSIRVVPQGSWHMNLPFPTKLEIKPPDGTTVAKPSLTKADAVKYEEAGCEFAVAFTPTEAGDKTFTGEFKFAVCQDTACVPKTETLQFQVAVK